MHLLLRCQMTSRHHWTLSSVGFWNVQDRRVNFYTRMSKFQAAVLNVCAPAQFQALLSDTRGGFCAVGQLAVCKEVLKRSLACSLCGKGGRSQPRAVQGSSASLTICPPWTHRFLCAVVILALVEALRKGLARILGTGPVLS